jgi:hypothetical protein
MLTRRLRRLPIGAQDIVLPHCFSTRLVENSVEI